MVKTYDELEPYIVPVASIIKMGDRIYAHTAQTEINADLKPELLSEHTARCLHYFKQLYIQKKWGNIFYHFETALFKEISQPAQVLFYEMLVNTIIFHDIGKINPNFQRSIMKNRISRESVSCLGNTHSLLSSAIYIDYFANRIKHSECEKEEQDKIWLIMLLNAYVISRHHGGLTPFVRFLNEFNENEKLFEIFKAIREGEFAEIYKGGFYQEKPSLNSVGMTKKNFRIFGNFCKNKEMKVALYTYIRFLFSILVSCDYYATTEYENGLKMTDFGNANDMEKICRAYEQSKRLQEIRKFNPEDYVDDGNDINVLRNCMFYEAEENLQKNREQNLFFLEAPTGGGKSNIALNCSFKLMDENIHKIFYVYPFNTLVEQNYDALQKIFGSTELFQEFAVINSITPIKIKKKENQKLFDCIDNGDSEENIQFYQRALLDRQFLNYPFILTTHVNLFQMMFGDEREAAISFYQLAGSVIVLDEIQSYKNLIWTEMMMFLECYSKLLNMKVIIMSATLPRLDYLTDNAGKVVSLIHNHEKYFEDERFKGRVKISYALLHENQKTTTQELYEHILANVGAGKKILVEFIKKAQAEAFYQQIKLEECEAFEVLCMTGDDNQIDRRKILSKIDESTERGIVLVATQVVEAGVDIDMDIGYKDISKLDSDEQFMGRINRNFRRDGIVYFFDMDDAGIIYRDDYRINRQYTLQEKSMREILENKDFQTYYAFILQELRHKWNELANDQGMEYFINQELGKLNFEAVAMRMQLINDDSWDVSVYLARTLRDDAGNVMTDQYGNELDGMKVWERYRELLMNQSMDYAQKQYELSQVKSLMNYFIYRIKKSCELVYNDKIGELYCIADADQYFEDGRLNKERFESQGAVFIE